MKLEEVVPHLRAGGKVKVGKDTYKIINNKLHFYYDGDWIYSGNTFPDILFLEFDIVKEPYKKEHIVKTDGYLYCKSIDGKTNWSYSNMFLKCNTTYKVTIEEIEE
jgi:hypothetical protein